MENKRLLLICPHFFGYHLAISEAFERLGYEVICFDDRPSTKKIVKLLLRINHSFLPGLRNSYYKRIYTSVKEKGVDIVLIIDGQSISKKFLSHLKSLCPSARFIYYLWDSLNNFKFCLKFLPFFDICYSYEKKDCEAHKELHYLPTFYRREYALKDSNNEHSYIASFIGTTRPKKYQFAETIKKAFKEYGYDNIYTYYYLPSKLMFWLYKITDRRFKGASIHDFHFKTISNDEVIKIYDNSLAVIDSPPDGQEGVTVRCYEAFAMKKKIITNNPNVKDIIGLDNNALVYPFNEAELREFISSKIAVKDDFYRTYSIDTFCENIISDNK